jgi:hypothetical protein
MLTPALNEVVLHGRAWWTIVVKTADTCETKREKQMI